MDDRVGLVTRFEDEFKNKVNHDIVDELMSEDFVHHLPYPGLPAGRAGMKAVGQFVTSALKDIEVTVTLAVGEGDLVADRIEGVGVRLDSGERIAWVENHFYRVVNGQITELWPAGGPDLT
jgi:predicted SnoaL-like aldol condensation-catalyzing enzyme